LIRSLAPNPDFQIGVKKRRSVSTLSKARGAEWVDFPVSLTLKQFPRFYPFFGTPLSSSFPANFGLFVHPVIRRIQLKSFNAD
jgi:hypothetical protein